MRWRAKVQADKARRTMLKAAATRAKNMMSDLWTHGERVSDQKTLNYHEKYIQHNSNTPKCTKKYVRKKAKVPKNTLKYACTAKCGQPKYSGCGICIYLLKSNWKTNS